MNNRFQGPTVKGSRIFLPSAHVNDVKKAAGKLAKVVRAVTGGVEVIHTHNGSGPTTRRCKGIYRLYSALKPWMKD